LPRGREAKIQMRRGLRELFRTAFAGYGGAGTVTAIVAAGQCGVREQDPARDYSDFK
jgi:hypothetical protein